MLNFTRRAALALGFSALAAMTTGCGSGETVSALKPTRMVSFGDGLSDLGQGSSHQRYTINNASTDTTPNVWTERLAARYSLVLKNQSGAAGTSYAQGHAATEAAPKTLSQQIDAFLTNNQFTATDVVLINLPMADVIQAGNAVKAGTQSETAALAALAVVAKSHVAQVNRLIAAGAQHLVVVGTYDMGKSPYAIAQGQVDFYTRASVGDGKSSTVVGLNNQFKANAAQLGTKLLYVDAGSFVNRNVLTPANYGYTNVNTAICTTPSALTCTSSTLVAGATATQYVFADGIHLTPIAQQQLGDYAYDQLISRW